jgi:hypothetical protein
MGSRDHACETCGLGGMNDARPCICGDSRCPTCDRVGADCPTLEVLVRSTVAQGEARRIALAAMKDCQAHRVEWRSRALAAEAELTAARETVARMESTLADQLKVTVVARQAVSDVVCQRNAALARVAAMEPVVEAANEYQLYVEETGDQSRCDPGEHPSSQCADCALVDAIDTFRSTSKPQEPTSE